MTERDPARRPLPASAPFAVAAPGRAVGGGLLAVIGALLMLGVGRG
ncbi:MAG: hypothetical protein M3O34_13005 [Chloroflexota bacterium]|nr:hypothetical protein [Chloroflexota bacterium]